MIRHRRARRLGTVVGMALLLLTPATGAAAEPAHADAATGPSGGPIVVLGTAGLTWNDVDNDAPTLAAWNGAIGNVVVRPARAVGCPLDGWLTLGAGERMSASGRCAAIPTERGQAAPAAWASWTESAAASRYSATLGTLGTAMAGAGVTTRAIGPGAAVALAQTDGGLESPAIPLASVASGRASADETAAAVTQALAGGASVVVVDLGAVDASGNARHAQVAAVDTAVAAVAAVLEPSATLWVASLGDTGTTAELRLVARQQADGSAGLLTAASTRHDGLVVLTDLTVELLTEAGATSEQTDALVGSTIGSSTTSSGDAQLAVRDVADHADEVAHLYPAWSAALSVGAALALGVIALGIRRVGATRAGVVLTAASALPLAVVIGNIVPWWRSPQPAVTFAAAIVTVVALTTTALWIRPLRRWTASGRAAVLLPAGGVTLLLLVDAATGGGWQLSGLLGSPPTVAGRYYGLHNQSFAIVGSASLLATATIAGLLVRAGRRMVAVAAVTVIGAIVTLVDGAAALGADFGGPPALVPGFALLGLLTAGVRLRRRHVGAILAAGATATVILAMADWLRPADERSHLGRFVADLVAGDAWGTVDRKLSENVGVLGGAIPTMLTLAAMIGIAVWTSRVMARAELSELAGWRTDHPLLGAGVVAAMLFALMGYALNDSGPVVPALVGYVILTTGGAALCRWAAAPGHGRLVVTVPTD